MCLIAVRRSSFGRTDCRRCGELVRPLVSVHRLSCSFLIQCMYCLFDPSVHSVAFSVDDFGLIPIYDVVERDSMICQRCILMNFEIVYCSTYEHIQGKMFLVYVGQVTMKSRCNCSRSANRLPDNLYCVDGDVKPCSINQSAATGRSR